MAITEEVAGLLEGIQQEPAREGLRRKEKGNKRRDRKKAEGRPLADCDKMRHLHLVVKFSLYGDLQVVETTWLR